MRLIIDNYLPGARRLARDCGCGDCADCRQRDLKHPSQMTEAEIVSELQAGVEDKSRRSLLYKVLAEKRRGTGDAQLTSEQMKTLRQLYQMAEEAKGSHLDDLLRRIKAIEDRTKDANLRRARLQF